MYSGSSVVDAGQISKIKERSENVRQIYTSGIGFGKTENAQRDNADTEVKLEVKLEFKTRSLDRILQYTDKGSSFRGKHITKFVKNPELGHTYLRYFIADLVEKGFVKKTEKNSNGYRYTIEDKNALENYWFALLYELNWLR